MGGAVASFEEPNLIAGRRQRRLMSGGHVFHGWVFVIVRSGWGPQVDFRGLVNSVRKEIPSLSFNNL